MEKINPIEGIFANWFNIVLYIIIEDTRSVKLAK